MKSILVLLLLGCKISMAQNFSYPKLPQNGVEIRDLVPSNWKLIDSTSGDLNQDLTADLALVLEYHEAISEKRAYGDAETALITEFQQPRILAVYFKDQKTGLYQFALQNNHFILRAKEGGAIGDPFRGLSIEQHNLSLNFEGGNIWRWKLNYSFQYKQQDWILTKANSTYYHKDSGEMTDKLYDFTARTLKLRFGNLFTRSIADEVIEEILFFSQPRTLKTFKKPWTWEIEKDNFL